MRKLEGTRGGRRVAKDREDGEGDDTLGLSICHNVVRSIPPIQ